MSGVSQAASDARDRAAAIPAATRITSCPSASRPMPKTLPISRSRGRTVESTTSTTRLCFSSTTPVRTQVPYEKMPMNIRMIPAFAKISAVEVLVGRRLDRATITGGTSRRRPPGPRRSWTTAPGRRWACTWSLGPSSWTISSPGPGTGPWGTVEHRVDRPVEEGGLGGGLGRAQRLLWIFHVLRRTARQPLRAPPGVPVGAGSNDADLGGVVSPASSDGRMNPAPSSRQA